ncbi:MAG: hypothetical protein RLZZ462_278, partial [Bacteroidota bacterium]
MNAFVFLCNFLSQKSGTWYIEAKLSSKRRKVFPLLREKSYGKWLP